MEICSREYSKLALLLYHRNLWWSRSMAPYILILSIDKGDWSASRPCRLLPSKLSPVPIEQESVGSETCLNPYGYLLSRSPCGLQNLSEIIWLKQNRPKFLCFFDLHYSIDLFHLPTLMHNFYSLTICMLHYNPRYVSIINMPIFRRTNCIITASNIVTLCKRLYSIHLAYCTVL